MNFQIIKIKILPKYKLQAHFKNGKKKLFDMKPYITEVSEINGYASPEGKSVSINKRKLSNKGIFKELKDESYFKKVRIVWGGIEWPHEQDLSADTLYYRGRLMRGM